MKIGISYGDPLVNMSEQFAQYHNPGSDVTPDLIRQTYRELGQKTKIMRKGQQGFMGSPLSRDLNPHEGIEDTLMELLENKHQLFLFADPSYVNMAEKQFGDFVQSTFSSCDIKNVSRGEHIDYFVETDLARANKLGKEGGVVHLFDKYDITKPIQLKRNVELVNSWDPIKEHINSN